MNGFNFPVPYNYAPGPGQYPGYYMGPPQPPEQPTPAVIPGPAPPTADSNPCETRKRGPPSEAEPPEAPKRRGPGRPRKNPTANDKSKKTGSPRRKRAKTTHGNAGVEKENQPVEITAQVIDVASDSEDEPTSKRWPVTDRDKFFKFLLGQDAEGDKRFEQHKKNPGHVYEVVCRTLLFKVVIGLTVRCRLPRHSLKASARSTRSGASGSAPSRRTDGWLRLMLSRGTAVEIPTVMTPPQFSRANLRRPGLRDWLSALLHRPRSLNGITTGGETFSMSGKLSPL